MKNTKRPASFIPCGARQGRAGISISARRCVTIVSSSNDDGNVNENGRTAIGFISKTTALHVHHTFLHISFPFLHDYDVKIPNFVFYGGRKQAMTKFYFSF